MRSYPRRGFTPGPLNAIYFRMVAPSTGRFAPVTLGHMRFQGCRDLLVECTSCHHRATMKAGDLPDHTAIRSLGDGIVCARCGEVGADVRPDWTGSKQQ
jgi:hypothetical protein